MPRENIEVIFKKSTSCSTQRSRPKAVGGGRWPAGARVGVVVGRLSPWEQNLDADGGYNWGGGGRVYQLIDWLIEPKGDAMYAWVGVSITCMRVSVCADRVCLWAVAFGAGLEAWGSSQNLFTRLRRLTVCYSLLCLKGPTGDNLDRRSCCCDRQKLILATIIINCLQV